ncbi:tetratricopeptide repeat protein [Idiomarina xiamenensis]|uniref:Tetratricopeptide repeat protein n=1 Tax=Idiomarina xiamenensis 10-D-4 TaxID=740709 RepID=K2LCK3_9GAMM|nr:CDC27 family protein [Idiomarina xiamenensis]EKE87615.1 hypothetical protein A10D4_00935 [Idiomarina xiamenensis 10-D-4]
MNGFKQNAVMLLLLLTMLSSAAVNAQQTERVPALREAVYSQLARAQEMADNGDLQGGLAVLKNVEGKLDSMNSYERAMLWNFYGFMYYEQERIDDAIRYFDQVVDEQPIPQPLRQNTLFSLAQLSMQQGSYQQVLSYLERWQANSDEPQSKALVLRAQALYQAKRFDEALVPINQAIKIAEDKADRPDENWLILQRAIYFELEQPQQVARVLEKMVRLFNKPEYWVQLAGMYGQLGQEQKQLAMLETAYQMGFLEKAADKVNLAQLYYLNNVPYKSAQVLAAGMQSGAIEENLRNLKLLAQSWVLAKETEKAVATLQKAAPLAEDGELYAQLAQVLLNDQQYQAAIRAAEQALAKGGLKKAGNMHVAIGMARLQLKQYEQALVAFEQAKQYDASAQMAAQWQKYTQSEQRQAQVLAELSS